MSAAQFIAGARALKGAKWQHQGRAPWALDCLGLIVLAAKASGLPIEDERAYGREPFEDRLRLGCIKRWGAPLDVKDARPADIALIRWGKCEPAHLGIIGDKPDGGLTLIHAHSIPGVVEVSLTRSYAQLIAAIFRPWKDGP